MIHLHFPEKKHNFSDHRRTGLTTKPQQHRTCSSTTDLPTLCNWTLQCTNQHKQSSWSPGSAQSSVGELSSCQLSLALQGLQICNRALHDTRPMAGWLWQPPRTGLAQTHTHAASDAFVTTNPLQLTPVASINAARKSPLAAA